MQSSKKVLGAVCLGVMLVGVTVLTVAPNKIGVAVNVIVAVLLGANVVLIAKDDGDEGEDGSDEAEFYADLRCAIDWLKDARRDMDNGDLLNASQCTRYAFEAMGSALGLGFYRESSFERVAHACEDFSDVLDARVFGDDSANSAANG